jgi:biopolymer transport protein ExbB/TolQ
MLTIGEDCTDRQENSNFWIVGPILAHFAGRSIPKTSTALYFRNHFSPLETQSNVKRLPSWITVLPSLVVPVCLGLSLYLGLQYLIDSKSITDETTLRYLIGHPVSKITVVMFLIGMSSMLVIGWNLISQFSAEDEITLGDELRDDDSEYDIREMAVDHGHAMLELPGRYHSHYLWERLVAAVHSIYRTGSTANVEEELKYLSDIDQERQQQRYSLVRILIWATPMLGFLGTVLGISQALGGIAVGPDNDFQQMMDGLRGNLYIAFDTTALALTLSMVMMFGLFLIERFESQLLRLVDQRARNEISRHYEIIAGGDYQSQQVVEAIQNVVVDQTEIWRDSIRKAEQAWMSTLSQTSDVVQSNLSESLDENIAALAHYLGEAIEKADMSISHRWSQWQVSLSENTRLMEKHMLNLGSQTESVQKIVETLDNSTGFEDALKHQQDAVIATTRTHRVLNELLEKVEQAGLLDATFKENVEALKIHAATEAENIQAKPILEPESAEVDEWAENGTDRILIFERESEPAAPSIRIFQSDDMDVAVGDDDEPSEQQTSPIKLVTSIAQPGSEVAEAEVAKAEVASEKQSRSARVVKALLGDSVADQRMPDVTFKAPVPFNKSGKPDDNSDSQGKRAA